MGGRIRVAANYVDAVGKLLYIYRCYAGGLSTDPSTRVKFPLPKNSSTYRFGA